MDLRGVVVKLRVFVTSAMKISLRKTCWMLIATLAAHAAAAQESGLADLVTAGQVTVGGRAVPYKVRHLPPDSFPELPHPIEIQLEQRGCLIPQTYEARGPENVIHGSFEQPGSSDWAVLCSAKGVTSFLVFLGAPDRAPYTLVTARETQRLQRQNRTGELGFNWGIDTAGPERIHEAQAGMSPRPIRMEHDAIADSTIDRKTIYHYFDHGKWTMLEMPE